MLLRISKVNDFEYDVIVETNDKFIGRFICDVDGFYYFSPLGNNYLLSDYALIELGEKLKELNRDWLDELGKRFIY